MSITPESSGAEEGESVEQGEQESQEQHNTPEKQEAKISGEIQDVVPYITYITPIYVNYVYRLKR